MWFSFIYAWSLILYDGLKVDPKVNSHKGFTQKGGSASGYISALHYVCLVILIMGSKTIMEYSSNQVLTAFLML